MEGKERLNLANDLAAGALGVEHLIEKAKEGAAHTKDPFAAVGSLLGLGKQTWGQEGSYEAFQVAETLLTELLRAPAERGQART
jgi:hypothetical protein